MAEATNRVPSPRIIVQGGAFSPTPNDNEKLPKYLKGIEESVTAGLTILKGGGTAIDAVEAAVCVLEKNKYLNAGFGSYLNHDNDVECEAMIMDGHTLDTGAVMTGKCFPNPVSIAKMIMQKTHHCALSGDGAEKFANERRPGEYSLCDPTAMISDRSQLLTSGVTYDDYPDFVKYKYPGKSVSESEHDGSQQGGGNGDTVSAVAMDVNGHLACATSTGGIAGKWKGRIGDAPLVGCGGYANENGAATITGHGESIMKMTLAREVVYMMENGNDAQVSAKKALEKMENRFPEYGYGGVIAIDKRGNFGMACNTQLMPCARIVDEEDEPLLIGMHPNKLKVKL